MSDEIYLKVISLVDEETLVLDLEDTNVSDIYEEENNNA